MKKYKEDDIFLAKWLSNDLTEEELVDFQNSEDYKIFSKIADKSTAFQIPAFDKKAVKTKIDNAISKPKSKIITLYQRVAIAASIAVLCVLGGMSYLTTTTTTLATNFGESKVFTLPDGSVAELNGKSSLSYNKMDWENDKRALLLEGEGYFSVEKGSRFTVKSKQGSVSVLGTQFNVKALNGFYAVACYEGKVLVEKNKKKTLLLGGNSVNFRNEKAQKTAITIVAPNWKTKLYVYDKIPLSVVFNDLQNVYKIAELDASTADLAQDFTGKLVVDDLEKALSIICKSMNLNYTLSKNSVIISVP